MAAPYRVPLLLALLAVLTGLMLPLLPVRVADPVVSWPKAGQPAEPTVALFMPYRPLELDVTLSGGLVAGPAPVTLFSTFRPDDVDGRKWGLFVTARDGQLRVDANGREVFAGPLGGSDSRYRVLARDSVLTVQRDGVEVGRAQTLVPQVAAFATEVPAARATGLISATAHADARFQATPTPLKYGFLVLSLGLAAACALTLVLRFRRRSPQVCRERRFTGVERRQSVFRGVLDAGVITVLVGWAFIGPMTTDDGFYTQMARNAERLGFAGNYYHWFNVPEAPFGTAQRLLAWLSQWSTAPLLLRLPSVVCGILCWLLLRAVLRRIQSANPQLHVPVWLLGAAFLCWWLPFNLGVRPEPSIALATALAAYCATRARLDQAPAWLAGAALTAGVAITITPTGLLALVPPLVVLPAVLRAAGPARLTVVALLAGAGSVALPLVFADVSLGSLLEATAVHGWYGIDLAWYQELQRYDALLGAAGEQGSAIKRVPVLLGLGLLGILAALRVRGRGALLTGPAAWPYLWLALGYAVLVLTPSKWTHHFGALAGFGALAVACALAQLPRVFAEARAGWLIRLGALGLLVLLLGAAWSGPNSWWTYSERGMAFRHDQLFGGLLGNPLLLLAIGLGLALLFGRAGEPAGSMARLFGGAATGLGRFGVVAAVLVVLGLFGQAALAERGSWSLASSALHSVTGSSCGLADAVRVRTGRQPLTTTEFVQANGFQLDRGFIGDHRPPAGSGPVWGSFLDLDRSTGTLGTPWFSTAVAPGDVLVVSAAGQLGTGNELTAEVVLPGAPATTQRLDDRQNSPDWRDFVVAEATSAGTARIRLHAKDGSTGRGGWLAVSAPGREHTHRLAGSTGPAAGPTLVDWPVSFAFPCVRPPVVAGGLAEPPLRMLADAPLDGVAKIVRTPASGGAFGNLKAVSSYRTVATYLPGDAPGELAWGRFVDIGYAYRTDGYEVREGSVERSGWWRGPSLATEEYAGREDPRTVPR